MDMDRSYPFYFDYYFHLLFFLYDHLFISFTTFAHTQLHLINLLVISQIVQQYLPPFGIHDQVRLSYHLSVLLMQLKGVMSFFWPGTTMSLTPKVQPYLKSITHVHH